MRSNGHARLSDVTAIVLDSDGTVGVLASNPAPFDD